MIQAIIQLLLGISGITSLLSSTVAIYQDSLPRGFALPAICAHKFDGKEPLDTNGPQGMNWTSIQIDCYANDAKTARSMAEAVKAELSGFKGEVTDGAGNWALVKMSEVINDLDMPRIPNANPADMAYHAVVQFKLAHSIFKAGS